jgi:hypothetical protein
MKLTTPYHADIKYEKSCTSTVPFVFRACAGTALTLPFSVLYTGKVR